MPENLWSFASRTYAQPGVAALCLHWQADVDADINLVLAGFWLAARRCCWTPDDIGRMQRQVRDWRNHAVLPLRAARIALVHSAIYPVLKRVELDAEHVQIAMIERGLAGRQMAAVDRAPSVCARLNVEAYAACLAAHPGGEAVERLLDAVLSEEGRLRSP